MGKKKKEEPKTMPVVETVPPPAIFPDDQDTDSDQDNEDSDQDTDQGNGADLSMLPDAPPEGAKEVAQYAIWAGIHQWDADTFNEIKAIIVAKYGKDGFRSSRTGQEYTANTIEQAWRNNPDRPGRRTRTKRSGGDESQSAPMQVTPAIPDRDVMRMLASMLKAGLKPETILQVCDSLGSVLAHPNGKEQIRSCLETVTDLYNTVFQESPNP